jgi:hypothetical protein
MFLVNVSEKSSITGMKSVTEEIKNFHMLYIGKL